MEHLNAKPQAEGEWSTGFCDWFSDCKTCCITMWCPCITYGRVTEIVEKGRITCGTAGTKYALGAITLSIGSLFNSYIVRRQMRTQYNIKGNACGDFFKHLFCEVCALTQLHRELKHRGFDMNLGWAENLERQQNQGGVAMSVPVFQAGMTR